jgi:hypothetical protein
VKGTERAIGLKQGEWKIGRMAWDNRRTAGGGQRRVDDGRHHTSPGSCSYETPSSSNLTLKFNGDTSRSIAR